MQSDAGDYLFVKLSSERAVRTRKERVELVPQFSLVLKFSNLVDYSLFSK